METKSVYKKLKYLTENSIIEGKNIDFDGFYFNCNNIHLNYSDYELNEKEEKILDYIYTSSQLNLLDETTDILKNKLSIDEEKELFTKLFLYDSMSEEIPIQDGMEVLIGKYLPKLNTKTENNEGKNAGQLFQMMATDELQEDKEFAKAILCLSGKNYIYLKEELKKDDELTDLAIKNDKSSFVISFQNAPVEYQEKSENGIKYIKRLYEQNQDIDADYIYHELFEKDDDGRYKYNTTLTSFKEDNQIQNEWLKDMSFTPQLVRIDTDFVEYIVDQKIEVTPTGKNLVKTK